MAEIKTNETHIERYIKIGRMAFHAISLYARCSEILTIHLQSNRCNLSITICTYAFH